ncbi:MAG: YjbE family putative metal transport protein [Alphaproteobacteria bacterium]|nr:YjbE family putative metal transport protein [Alphaproteobacteria bacterium]
MELWLTGPAWAFVSVILIDLALSADNAVVVGMAAAALEPKQRARAITIGIVAAVVFRIALALIATQLLAIIGLLLAGGLLLLWVSWKLWREIDADRRAAKRAALAGSDASVDEAEIAPDVKPAKSFREAVTQITIADISMSLDNVLAVAGAAREHPYIMVFGLGLSILLMAVGAQLIARMLKKHRWIAYLGLAIIVYVSIKMIWEGGFEVWDWLAPKLHG